MKYRANIYPNNGINSTVENSNSSKSNIGFCFSGGGMRSLSCVWGQMLGLKNIDLFNHARYISSVSTASWATAIYSFLPKDYLESNLLGKYYPPEKLFLKDIDNGLNLNRVQKNSFGYIPTSMDIKLIFKDMILFILEHHSCSDNYRHLWSYIISKYILKPFGLRNKGETKWLSNKHFALSLEKSYRYFTFSHPKMDDFIFLRNDELPFPIINTNMIKSSNSNKIYLPIQITPIASGYKGKSPDSKIDGGGMVETYGFCSLLDDNVIDDIPVNILISDPYSIVDSLSSSSALYAQYLAKELKECISDDNKRDSLIDIVKSQINDTHKRLLSIGKYADELEIYETLDIYIKKIVSNEEFIDKFIPSYNYWPISKNSENTQMQFSDGATLDNTGVLGLLSQSDEGKKSEPLKIVVFDNSDIPLEKKDGRIIAASAIAPLFGIDFNEKNGKYRSFTKEQKDYKSKKFKETSLIEVFDNKKDQFSKLLKGLYNSSCENSKENIHPAFFKIELKTIKNSLANISENRTIELLYIQNSKILSWQNRIKDKILKSEIIQGQNNKGKNKDFKGFPYYSSFEKINLKPKETNLLAQMWAWAICDDNSKLKRKLEAFMF